MRYEGLNERLAMLRLDVESKNGSEHGSSAIDGDTVAIMGPHGLLSNSGERSRDTGRWAAPRRETASRGVLEYPPPGWHAFGTEQGSLP